MKALPKGVWKWFLLLSACFLQLFFASVYAQFVNGDFEAPYFPTGTSIHDPITGWTQTGYLFLGSASPVPPSSISDINLQPQGSPGNSISDIIFGVTQSMQDYFLDGSTPPPTLALPVSGNQTAMINVRWVNFPHAIARNTNVPPGWMQMPQEATAFSQIITITSADFDLFDQMVHVRFKLAPVLENPPHFINQQPFYAVQLNKVNSNGTTTALYFQWRYAGQPGVPWVSLTGAGTNPGSNLNYQYTNWQAFDIAPGNALIQENDQIELIVLTAGCSPAGDEGHVYLDDVQTRFIFPTLWVAATGPTASIPGRDITYTYTYRNMLTTAVENVQVVANMPLQGTPVGPPESTTFVSVTAPTVGVSPTCIGSGPMGPVTCSIGRLEPGQVGTFQLTVHVPASWPPSTGPVNNGNYPISADGVAPLLGPLVQTTLVTPSNLIPSTSGLPPTATVGIPYTGTYTCTNSSIPGATGDALDASCSITNLPPGLTVTGCTLSPFNVPWTEPSTIPANQTVTCTVGGIPTTTGVVTSTVTANSVSNPTPTQASITITIGLVNIPATLNGLPIVSPAAVCCGRPVILGPLPIPGSAPTHYFVSGRTGNAVCMVGRSGTQTYLKVNGLHGSCTVTGVKNGVSSNPFTVCQ